MRLTLIAASAAIACAATAALGGEQPSVGQDLQATIALHGLPCDRIIDTKRNGDSDYLATCKDGNRYHVFVDARGRVIVQKL
jgi:hypothetical protein